MMAPAIGDGTPALASAVLRRTTGDISVANWAPGAPPAATGAIFDISFVFMAYFEKDGRNHGGWRDIHAKVAGGISAARVGFDIGETPCVTINVLASCKTTNTPHL